jgi:hypothetical protein
MATHDPSYKRLFSHRKMVSDPLCGCMHEEWAERLDFNTLERVREVGISQDLRERVDDVIRRLRIIEDGRRAGSTSTFCESSFLESYHHESHRYKRES